MYKLTRDIDAAFAQVGTLTYCPFVDVDSFESMCRFKHFGRFTLEFRCLIERNGLCCSHAQRGQSNWLNRLSSKQIDMRRMEISTNFNGPALEPAINTANLLAFD